MNQVDVRPKTITQNQITGEHGATLVKAQAHAMGFLYTVNGPVEAGVDGLIETRDKQTGRVGARFVAVQVKTTDAQRYTAETDSSFEYLCEPEDVAYWQLGNLPVIIVLVRLSDKSLFWKQAPIKGSPVDPETRRLRINKATDRFDLAAGDAIAALAVDQAEPGVWLPPSRQPDALLFNAVKVRLPGTIHFAATTHRHGRDALRALLELSDHPPGEWVARGGRLITFLDIQGSLLRHVVDRASIETFPVDQFSLEDDDDEQRLFVELLNRTLRAQLDPILVWSRLLRLYHFPADGRGIDRMFRYRSLKYETSRAVVKAKRRKDGSVSYVRHSAFSGRFWREFDDWYFTVEPSYLFTRDGVRPDRFAGERISKLKRLENNAALRGQFVMWRGLLTGLGVVPEQVDWLAPEPATPILGFEALDMMSLPMSVPDDLWRARDSDAPDDGEELPL
jgi:hypothetical protein